MLDVQKSPFLFTSKTLAQSPILHVLDTHIGQCFHNFKLEAISIALVNCMVVTWAPIILPSEEEI